MIRALCLFLAVTAGAMAQPRSGELRIEVRDPAGAPMEAEGHLQGAGITRVFRTDTAGSALLTALVPGRYRLELKGPGFAVRTATIDVVAGKSVNRQFTMELAVARQNVAVIAPTPIAGVELDPSEIPAPVEAATAGDLRHAFDLSDLLNRRFDAVYINEVQGNPFQPDVSYRGYTASPLLGTPQGLSIYMDGVRLNQPFGDVVNWDLIPRTAISEVVLMPGSNPVFGRNTLGGALSIETKSGTSSPGVALALSGGSFGRKAAEFEYGGSTTGGFNWYGASNLFFEDGWRRQSPSNVRQFFGRVGRQFAATSAGLTVGYVDNALNGNALQEQRLLARDYASVYTSPDITVTKATWLTLNLRHSLRPSLSLSTIAYYRFTRSSNISSDINENSLDQALYQPGAAERAALSAAGYTGFPASGESAANTPFPKWRCIAQALLNDEPGEKCNGMINRNRLQQANYGISVQVSHVRTLASGRNQLIAGAGYDGSAVQFAQASRLGYVNPDRTITGIRAWADGVNGGSIDGKPFDLRAGIHGRIDAPGLYATDTLSYRRWTWTASVRYDHSSYDNRDRIRPPGPGSLTARHTFSRLNPAAGLTYNAARGVNLYAAYSEAGRAPTSVELGCADPYQACKLPNALAGDPPLRQVVARTVEAGVRGEIEGRLHWGAGWFRAVNMNDILFVSSTESGFGYFRNFGRTLRQGAELSLRATFGRLSAGAGYTFLEATYQTSELVSGSNNSANDSARAGNPGLDGVIAIRPGDHIPLIPQQILKSYADLQATRQFSLGLNFIAAGSSYARGNENNLNQSDGRYYLGTGTSPGYGVLNASGDYRIGARIVAFVECNNLLDRHYYTGAQLGATPFTPTGNFIARPFGAVNGNYPLVRSAFYAPGAPRGVWVGLRFRF